MSKKKFSKGKKEADINPFTSADTTDLTTVERDTKRFIEHNKQILSSKEFIDFVLENIDYLFYRLGIHSEASKLNMSIYTKLLAEILEDGNDLNLSFRYFRISLSYQLDASNPNQREIDLLFEKIASVRQLIDYQNIATKQDNLRVPAEVMPAEVAIVDRLSPLLPEISTIEPTSDHKARTTRRKKKKNLKKKKSLRKMNY